MEPTTITLGGKSFTVRPLTMRQLRIVFPAFAKVGGALGPESVDAAVTIILAGISRDAPDMTTDTVLDLEAPVPAIIAAVRTIAEISGFAPAGEAPAAAT